tara:strand:- start:461 stop:1765 length:1305 start_codon:yes stop_codon:yes gene_type:complete
LAGLLLIIFVSLSILLHEIGHLLFARAVNLPISNVNIGFGKKLFKFSLCGITITVRLIPLGGFVEVPFFTKEKYSYAKDMFVACGGSFFNLLLAMLFFTIGYMAGGHVSPFKAIYRGDIVDNITHNGTKIVTWKHFNRSILISTLKGEKNIIEWNGHSIKSDPIQLKRFVSREFLSDLNLYPISKKQKIHVINTYHPCLKGKVARNDKLIMLNDHFLLSSEEIPVLLSKKNRPLRPVIASFINNKGKIYSESFTPLNIPYKKETFPSLGMELDITPIQTHELSFSDAIYSAFADIYLEVMINISVMASLLVGSLNISDLSGPIAIYGMISKIISFYSLGDYALLFGWFNLVFGIFNLMPIPPLDGGVMILRSVFAPLGPIRSIRWIQLFRTLGTILLVWIVIYVFTMDLKKATGDIYNVLGLHRVNCDNGNVAR